MMKSQSWKTTYWPTRVVSMLVLTLALLFNNFLLLVTNAHAANSIFPTQGSSACPVTGANKLSHRYIIFLDGINSLSTAGQPLNSDFERIQDCLIQLGIQSDHFVYFSYSGVHESKIIQPVSFSYCLGWGINNCSQNVALPKDPTVSLNPDLINLSASPIYADTDTHQSIVKQADVLEWLIRQIVRDQSAQLDLIGFSLGGVVASYWASRVDRTQPLWGYIHSIVLIDSPVNGISFAGQIFKAGCSKEWQCALWSKILADGVGSIWPGYGRTVLSELQLAVDDPNKSIVASLSKATDNFPITAIQSTADYLVNGQGIPLCNTTICNPIGGKELFIVGEGAQSWPIRVLHAEQDLGGHGIIKKPMSDTDVQKLAEWLRVNHEAALTAQKTIDWVIEAVLSETTLLIGLDAVWGSSSENFDKVQACIGNTQNNCILTVMRETSASPQAIAIAERIGNNGYLADFKEMGRVDLGAITYPLAANGNFGNPVLLNGMPSIILVNDRIAEDDASGNLDLRSDPTYSSLAHRFPDLTSDPNTAFETIQSLSAGGQRFIFTVRLLNGCYGCEQVGTAHIALDFDETGKFLDTKLVSIESSAPSTPSLRATATEDGKVYLGNSLLLDTQQESSGCFGVGEISYSPTADYFLVLLQCLEGDNEGFIFRADGSGKRHITGEWDYINDNHYEWSPDGDYLTYQRINSCCAPVPATAPPAGRVQYNVRTGAKTLLAPAERQPVPNASIIEQEDGSYSLDGDQNCMKRMLAETRAAVVVWGADASHCRGITEGEHSGTVLGEFQSASEIHYELNGNEFVLCDYKNCIHAYDPKVHRIHGIVQGICDFYVNRLRQTPSCTAAASLDQPEIISNDRATCHSAKGKFPLVVSAIEDSPWCLILPEGHWGGAQFDKFVLNGQVWTWVKEGCEYRLNDDSGDGELKVDYSPKVVRGIVGTIDYVNIACH